MEAKRVLQIYYGTSDANDLDGFNPSVQVPFMTFATLKLMLLYGENIARIGASRRFSKVPSARVTRNFSSPAGDAMSAGMLTTNIC